MKLNEWKDANGNQVGKPSSSAVSNTGNTSTGSSSAGYKKRFIKLFDYCSRHKYSKINLTNLIKVTEDTLEFIEHYDTGNTVEYQIYIGTTTGAWNLKIYTTDDLEGRKKAVDLSGMGWVKLLKELRYYITVPTAGTPEYKDLLTEWLDKDGKTVHVNTSPAPSKTSNTPVGKIPDQTYRYKRLLAQIDADGFCKYTVNLLDSRTLDITLKNGVEVKLERNDHFPIYTLTIEDTSQSYDDYEDVLDALIIEGIIGDTDLCESASFAEDFRLYESLWD